MRIALVAHEISTLYRLSDSSDLPRSEAISCAGLMASRARLARRSAIRRSWRVGMSRPHTCLSEQAEP
jgi:hypothetical protein